MHFSARFAKYREVDAGLRWYEAIEGSHLPYKMIARTYI
jgi:hypothetical protein